MSTLLSIVPGLHVVCLSGKANKEMTEEMMLKKTEKNRKRRQAAQRRKEKRKVCVYSCVPSHCQCGLCVGRDSAQTVRKAVKEKGGEQSK